ncbi:sigma factor [Nocardia sp. NPDC127606]|uniref:sigma factor n=1 Tax=Nocardia sp. NPDC127606 TaxID=3345406 RepID=UPI003644D394
MSTTTALPTYEHAEPLFAHLALTDPRSPEHDALRDQIIEICLPLAENIARKYAGRGEAFDDLVQTARLGVVMAVDRYDVSTGSPFWVSRSPPSWVKYADTSATTSGRCMCRVAKRGSRAKSG